MKEVLRFNKKEEFFNYLENFDFEKNKRTSLDRTYFLIKYYDEEIRKELIKPFYCFKRDDGNWAEGECELHIYPNTSLLEWLNLNELGICDPDDELMPLDTFEEDRIEHDKIFQIDGTQYDNFNYGIFDILPNDIEILDIFNEKQCLEYLLDNKNDVKRVMHPPFKDNK